MFDDLVFPDEIFPAGKEAFDAAMIASSETNSLQYYDINYRCPRLYLEVERLLNGTEISQRMAKDHPWMLRGEPTLSTQRTDTQYVQNFAADALELVNNLGVDCRLKPPSNEDSYINVVCNNMRVSMQPKAFAPSTNHDLLLDPNTKQFVFPAAQAAEDPEAAKQKYIADAKKYFEQGQIIIYDLEQIILDPEFEQLFYLLEPQHANVDISKLTHNKQQYKIIKKLLHLAVLLNDQHISLIKLSKTFDLETARAIDLLSKDDKRLALLSRVMPNNTSFLNYVRKVAVKVIEQEERRLEPQAVESQDGESSVQAESVADINALEQKNKFLYSKLKDVSQQLGLAQQEVVKLKKVIVKANKRAEAAIDDAHQTAESANEAINQQQQEINNLKALLQTAEQALSAEQLKNKQLVARLAEQGGHVSAVSDQQTPATNIGLPEYAEQIVADIMNSSFLTDVFITGTVSAYQEFMREKPVNRNPALLQRLEANLKSLRLGCNTDKEYDAYIRNAGNAYAERHSHTGSAARNLRTRVIADHIAKPAANLAATLPSSLVANALNASKGGKKSLFN